MRVAILDLGTNTFHLLIADVGPGSVVKKFKSKKAVKLGEGAIHRNTIAQVPFKRGLETMAHYKEIINKYKPEKVFAFGTSAIRSADNGADFVSEVKKKTGIAVRVISGDHEAELICYGVRQCIDLKNKPALIMDIGGGSTEFIIANNKEIIWKKSFNIGAARLLEMFRPSNPISGEEIESIHEFLDKKLIPLADKLKNHNISKLVGSSGSFDTFATMAGYRFHSRDILSSVNSYKFDLKEFIEIYNHIIASKVADRMKMKGLIRMRVDMIVIAAICTEYILRKFEIREMYLSKFALKEGALWKEVKNLQIREIGN